jgi:hypothetical protein
MTPRVLRTVAAAQVGGPPGVPIEAARRAARAHVEELRRRRAASAPPTPTGPTSTGAQRPETPRPAEPIVAAAGPTPGYADPPPSLDDAIRRLRSAQEAPAGARAATARPRLTPEQQVVRGRMLAAISYDHMGGAR